MVLLYYRDFVTKVELILFLISLEMFHGDAAFRQLGTFRRRINSRISTNVRKKTQQFYEMHECQSQR